MVDIVGRPVLVIVDSILVILTVAFAAFADFLRSALVLVVFILRKGARFLLLIIFV